MTITSYGTGAYRSARTDTFVSSRTELEDLQRQLATQKRSETYGGIISTFTEMMDDLPRV